MGALKYDAVGLGNADVQLGQEFFAKAKANKLTVLDASPFADKSAVPYIIRDVGGVKVGVISFGMLPPDAKVNEYELRKSRFIAYKEVRAKCDVLILLDESNTATEEWLKRNSERLGAPDIVLGGAQRAALRTEQVVGTTHVMPSMIQAKEMGVVDVEFTAGQPLKMTAARVDLDETFPEDESVSKRVGEAILATGGVATVPSAILTNAAQPANPVKPYYSPLHCKFCHEKQYNDWAQTKHAKALKALVAEKRTTPDCLPCHSEVFRVSQRYIPMEGDAGGVECATCHVKSLPHGLDRRNVAQRIKVDPKLCVECHTQDRSPAYDEKTYFPKVVHAIAAPTTTASVSK